MEDDHEDDALDQIAEDFKKYTGGRNMRTEAAALRGTYLSRWMDLELNLDELITEYLEVPDSKREDMTDGLLPEIMSVNVKVEFLELIVRRVDPTSKAHTLTRQAQVIRNALAHKAANWADISPEVQAGAIAVVNYKGGRRRTTYIEPNVALSGLKAAIDAIYELTLKARPDYVERMKARTRAAIGAGPSSPNLT
ncbi:hypothetical protein ACFQU3_10665 [Terrabacter sp. GCM10028922]|uniref:hypothetical protein n=1 Tax=Terrabacter sp. GCM10028922 TaxID=3273428 RepID=UPI003617FEA9